MIYTLGRKQKLGDSWAQLSWLLQRSRPMLTEQSRGPGSRPVRAWVAEIVAQFATDAEIRWVPGSGGRRFPARRCFQHEYLPTRARWVPGGERVVCVQVDGRWKAELKNPSAAERDRLLAGLQDAGCVVREIGQPLTLAESIGALASCHCFIGVDSGMMHVANSVRCPRILIRNRMFDIDATYRGKALVFAETAEAALRLLA